MIDDKGLSLLYGEITGESSEKNESRNKTVKLANVATPRNEKVLPIDVPELSFIGLDDIEAHTMKQLGSKVASGLKSSAKRFYKGDLLYSRLRPYLNKVWRSNKDGICSSEFIVIPENENIDTRFLAYRLNATDFVAFANSLNAGDRPRVDFKQISLFEIPAFSLSQQQEVVVKIEELFSELDSGIVSLKTAREQLKIYRQALLKHAFEGKLTEQWRKDNADKLETPEQLLARIQTERKTRYQQQLNDWKQAVKDWEVKGKENRKPTKPKSLTVFIDATQEEKPYTTPLSWSWQRLGILITGVNQGWSPRCESIPADNDNWGVIKTTAIQHGNFNDKENKALPKSLLPKEQHELKVGDILITRAGPRVRVGVCCLVRKVREKLMNCDKVYRIRALNNICHSEYIEAVLNSPVFLDILEEVKSGINDSGVNLNQKAFLNMLIPVCSLEEQQEIINQLEEKLSNIVKLEFDIADQIAKAETLRQSILKKAFSGMLVQQDLSDEPVSELLARIHVEKALTNKEKSCKTRRAK